MCPHLHVPMQSGDDGVLRAMGRHYTAREYLQAIESLREAVPEVNVTTDIIVGFPNEDEAAFERTLELVREAGISRVHAFSYSPRPGTAARGARRQGGAGGEEAPLAGAEGPLGGALAPPSRGQAGRNRAGAGGQGRRDAVLGLHRRLHALLPAGGRRRARASWSR